MREMPPAGLEAVNLTVGYRRKGQAPRKVLSDLSLRLEAGEFACLLGPNGAGKSTLIRVLAGIEPPLEGRVFAGGESLAEMSPRDRARRISVVLTESLPMGAVTGRSVVALGRHPHTNWTGMLTPRDRERIRWALTAVRAEALADRQVSELSDGERQKIMLARALAQEASIMLLDEPTAYLDLPRRVELMRTLRDLSRREGLCILLSTHDLDLALRCADKLWLVDAEGRLISGVPEELALDGTLARTFASADLDWDEEHGSFRMHREPCAFARVEGQGPALQWTRRALMRIGYGLTAEGQEAAVAVTIQEVAGSGREWLATAKGEQQRFPNLGKLLDWMLNPSRYDAGRPDPRQRSEKERH